MVKKLNEQLEWVVEISLPEVLSGSNRGTTAVARTGTSGPLQRLEPVPLVLKTDRYNVLVSMNEVQSLDHTTWRLLVHVHHRTGRGRVQQ